MTRRFLFSALALLALTATACGRYLTTGIAVVNGVSISTDQLDKQLAAVSASQQGAFDPNNPQQRLDVQRQIIVSLIQQELIRQEAVRLHFVVTSAQIDQGLAQVRAQFQTDQEFQTALAIAEARLRLARLRRS